MDKLKMQQWVDLVDDTIPAAKHKDMARDYDVMSELYSKLHEQYDMLAKHCMEFSKQAKSSAEAHRKLADCSSLK